MKLLTQEIRNAIPKLYSQEKNKDPMIVAKFFTPWTNWTWYVIEGQPEGDDFRFFGLVEGLETEMGYFMLNELESIKGRFGLKIERDLHFTPCPLSQVSKKN